GCVMYEMLTGRRVFGGEDVAETLAAILTKAPDWALFPTQTPAPIRTLLRRCLEKDPRHRLDSAAAARLEIDDALTIGPASQLEAWQSPRRAAWIRTVPWLLCGLLILALATAWLRLRPGPPEPGRTGRLELNLPDGVELFGATAPAVALSPDGT